MSIVPIMSIRAIKQENKPRTFKEICAVMPGVPKKDIGRCYSIIVQVTAALAPQMAA